MKKTFILFCCAAALVTGLNGCRQQEVWLKRGFDTGDMSTTTFTGNYSDL